MNIHLPGELESSVQAAVRDGRFESIDDAMAEAARLLLREIAAGPSAALIARRKANGGMGSLGAMRDAADELDQIVTDAMKRRREEDLAGRFR